MRNTFLVSFGGGKVHRMVSRNNSSSRRTCRQIVAVWRNGVIIGHNVESNPDASAEHYALLICPVVTIAKIFQCPSTSWPILTAQSCFPFVCGCRRMGPEVSCAISSGCASIVSVVFAHVSKITGTHMFASPDYLCGCCCPSGRTKRSCSVCCFPCGRW